MTFPTDWQYKVKLTSDNTKVAAAIKGLAVDLSNMPVGFWSNVWKNNIPREQNIVAYYKLDETSGTTASDSAGSNDITLTSSSLWDSGKINGGIKKTGSEYTYSDFHLGTSDFTLNLWHYERLNNQASYPLFIASNINDWNSGNKFWIYKNDDGLIRPTFREGSSSQNVQGSIALNENSWNMITITRVGNTVKLYVNGVLDNSGSNTFFDMSFTSSFTKYMGRTPTGTSGDVLFFHNDEVLIANVEFSAQEVEDLYNAQKDGFESGQFNPTGRDIRITDSSNNLVARDVVSVEKITAASLTADAVAYYKFDGDVTDSAASNNGTAHNTPTYATGQINNGITFNGSTQYMSASGFSLTNTYTVAMWVKANSLAATQFIFSGGGSTTNRYPDIVLNTSGRIDFGTNNTDARALSTTLISTDEWVHVVGVAEGKNKKIYINGVLEGNVTTANDNVFFSSINIGRRGDATGYYNGMVDETFVSGKAYSASEIKALYNLQKGGHESGQYPFVDTGLGLVRFDTSSISTGSDTDYYIWYGNASATEPAASDTYGQYNAYDSNLRAYYPMNEDSGSTMMNRTENAANGTNSNITLSQEGVLGDAYGFNGTSSTSNVGTAISLTSKSFSICAWYRNTKTGANSYAFSQHTAGSTRNSLHIGRRNAGQFTLAFYSDDLNSNTNMSSDGTWQRWTATYDSSTKRQTLYLNGQEDALRTAAGDLSASGGNFLLGNSPFTTGQHYGGRLNQVFVWYKELSADEDLTFYNNESDNASFWTFGTQEDASGITITTLPASNITFNSAQLNGEVANYD